MPKKLFSLIALLALLGAGCGNNTVTSTTSSAAPDNTKYFSFKAADGGIANLDFSDGAKAKIIFPQGTLANDSELAISPLANSSDWLIPGFSLVEKNHSSGPAMDAPALLVFSSDKDLGTNISIFRRDADKDVMIPSKVTVKDGHTTVTAAVTHFSNYGIRHFTDSDTGNKDNSAQNYNWVIYVKDSADVNIGAMQRKINLDFKVVNTSGDIGGLYQGYAHATTNNDMEAMGGKMDADFQIKDDNVSFSLEPYVELAPLTERDDGLANLEPEKLPDMMGNGTLHMGGSGVASGRIGAYGGSRGVDATDSSDPFTVSVTGPLVRLSVTITGVGTQYFDGYIIGEGK